MLGITTLEEYFSWLKTLSSINKKYTVLPLDEEYFEINANTRAINIPAAFKKNGIAVQGDDLAEILYFKVDRYFDYMDLNNTDIFIQWETPKDANGNQVKSVSPAYIRDIESEPGKLIFGWAISDAITGSSGTLKFSVRFFQWEEPDKININENGVITEDSKKIIAYSFSTLTASVNINPSINLNLEVDEFKIDDPANRLIDRIGDSVIVGGYAAAEPEFVVEGFEFNINDKDAPISYDLNPETNEYKLYAQAYASDTGGISYVWKYKDLYEDNTENSESIITIDSVNEWIEVDKENLTEEDSKYTYWVRAGLKPNGEYLYNRYEGSIPPTESDNLEGKELYIQLSRVIANKAGIYYVNAENRITNSSSTKTSEIAKFPKPEYINITKQPDRKGILQDVSTEENSLSFEYPLSVSVGNEDGVLTYQWLMAEDYSFSFEGGNEEYVEIEGATEKDYKATEPGHYKVVIKNTRNRASKELVSEVSRITYTAKSPVLIEDGASATVFNVENLSDTNCPTIVMDPNIESDRYSVSWYFVEGELNVPVVENILLEPGVLKASFNPKNYEEIILALGEQKDIDGSYYAIVTNHVNGSQASTEVPTFAEMFKVVS